MLDENVGIDGEILIPFEFLWKGLNKEEDNSVGIMVEARFLRMSEGLRSKT